MQNTPSSGVGSNVQGSSSVPSTNPSSSASGTFFSSTMVNEKDIQNVPKDAIIIEKILQSMGIKEFEPRVTEQLLELVYRYVYEVIEDSFVYMDHAGRSDLDLEDVRLSIQSRVNHSYTEPPPVEFLLEVANQKNSQPILLPKKPRVLLPPQHLCLANRNYQFSKTPTTEEGIAARKKRKQTSHADTMDLNGGATTTNIDNAMQDDVSAASSAHTGAQEPADTNLPASPSNE
ncbi:hypothetical protein C9374_009290 [Naegleria lovaniensis]|uniref:Transcription initiation factor TFIID subunit 9 n=1 Tax=Naegleria lovaniensis TaxID=51637 RepID=A0AA88GDE5_NAELO|nr:uncharacterized protein C9374_009290 [Naegleria lovaniensis]KAG2377379.1 hypothetical protein C9374_009290 [Naegleria lovaniensis]